MQVLVKRKDNMIVVTPHNVKPKHFPEIVRVVRQGRDMVAVTRDLKDNRIILGEIPDDFFLLKYDKYEVVFQDKKEFKMKKTRAQRLMENAVRRVAERKQLSIDNF